MAYVAMPGMMQPGVMMVAPSNWTTSIFDCFQDVNSCLDVYFCYCCANARQYDAVAGIPDSMNIMILIANICLGTTYLINCCVRCNVAQRFNIDENNCLSCCCAMWLPSCSMCQTHRELTNRGLWPGGTLCSQPPVGYVPIVAPMGGMAVVSPMMAPQVVIQPQPVIYSTY